MVLILKLKCLTLILTTFTFLSVTLLVYPPTQIVRRLKQESTRQIWLLHPSTLRKQYWYKNMFWSDGYFVCSIGEACPDTIGEYILSQG